MCGGILHVSIDTVSKLFVWLDKQVDELASITQILINNERLRLWIR